MPKIARSHIVILVLGLIAALPALKAGFFADDFAHIMIVSGRLSSIMPITPIDMFRFSSGDPVWLQKMIGEGVFPWWTDPHFKGAFFRPLSAVTHILDYRHWGMNPVGYHATNILLWLLVLVAAVALIRRIAPTPRAAILSFFIFALADARALVIIWIANRNALVATALAFAALVAWDSHRREPGRLYGIISYILFGLSLLGGEAALGGVALLFAYEVLRLPDGRPTNAKRLKALVPFMAIITTYLLWYKLAGYGASGSGMYIDPASHPLAWIRVAAVRLPVLLAGLLWGWPIDLWMNGGATQTTLIAGALVLLPLSIGVFATTVRKHRSIAAIALGGVLSLLPVASTFPSARLLLLPGLAGALVLGTYLDDAWPLRSAGLLRAAFAAIVGLRHVILAPFLLLISMFALGDAFKQISLDILNSPWPENVATRDIVLVNAPTWVSATYLQSYLAAAGRPYPRRTYILNLSPYPATLSRNGPTTLELRFRCGEMLTSEFEKVERGSPIPVGTVIDAGIFHATVLESGTTGPTAVRFDFRQSFDTGPLFVRWIESRYEPVDVPALGSALELPALAQGVGRLRAPAPVCK